MPFDSHDFAPFTLTAPVTPVQLPHIPSQLIRLALADLRKVEAMPEKYRVNMGDWHRSDTDDGRCSVCLAGSVLAMSVGFPSTDSWTGLKTSKNITSAAYALNDFRCAFDPDVMKHACAHIGATPIPFSEYIPRYARNPAGFHTVMHALADAFEASGQ